MAELEVDEKLVADCHKAAAEIADGVDSFISGLTTTSVERTVIRLLGVNGVDADKVPVPNIMVDQLKEAELLNEGAAHCLGKALLAGSYEVEGLARAVARGEAYLPDLIKQCRASREEVTSFVSDLVEAKAGKIKKTRQEREELKKELSTGPRPWLYVIVATGNIYEDVRQARAAARQGADIIAVIRSTAQSLLDYVPYGPTTEGFGGTYATQENFRIMREALDEVGQEVGRYIQLVNYCSGLCMPEIAALGALERLDMMLNDAMYGILFRDINMKRTFIDQYFSRLINAYAGIIINTGEDNYLTTADSLTEAHTVIASQFINQELARRSCLPPELMGLGHAFEIDPALEDGFLLELAQAQLVRQLFPEAPLKYMPPTKYMTGDIFQGHLQDGMFNLASIITGQGIQLLGMLTEAIHTPFIQDRALSLDNARYIFNNCRNLGQELEFKSGGRIQARADEVLKETAEMLAEIGKKGLIPSLEEGIFAGIKRPRTGGKGSDGVLECSRHYYNPFADLFRKELSSQ